LLLMLLAPEQARQNTAHAAPLAHAQAPAATPEQEAASRIDLEQVCVNMPSVTAFLRLDNAAAFTEANATASLGSTDLAAEQAGSLQALGEGTQYYCLVDVSTSISPAQMAATRAALHTLYDRMSQDDVFILISFGEHVTTLLEGKEAPDAAHGTIEALLPDQAGTEFYQAIERAVEVSEVHRSDYPERKVAVVVSDGVPYSQSGGVTRGEVLAKLQGGTLPLYSVCIENNGSDPDSFGELSRASGGRIEAVSSSNTDGIAASLAAQQDYIQSVQALRLKAPSNVVSKGTEQFLLELGFGTKTLSASAAVQALRWQPDNEPPTVASIEQDGDSKIVVSLSERLDASSANGTGGYIIRDAGGASIPLESASYSATGATSQVSIVLGGVPYDGSYTLEFNGITDDSMEKNPLAGPVSFELRGQPVVLLVLKTVFLDFWWVLLIVALLVVGLIVYRVLKKRKGLVKVEGAIGFGDAVEFKQHFSTPSSKQVRIVVTDTLGNETPVDFEVFGSIFVGRSNTNNLSFDDSKLSRQHFVIEAEGDNFYLSDLNSSNGTCLNGVRIAAKCPLAPGDVITAGNEKFVFQGALA
jgi:Mg-chelatase subunit ChlD